ncbi:MAG: OmpA family protein [Myxococcota bacterium]|nr:OmpA family protein [Myxococcota bacterium]
MLTLLLLMTSPLRAELPIEDDAWIPLRNGDGSARDEADLPSSMGHLDIVGDTAQPVGHWSMDEADVYIRMRLAASPAALAPVPYACGFVHCQWGVLVNTDDDRSTFERALVLSNGAATLRMRSGVTTAGWTAGTDTLLFGEPSPLVTGRVRSAAAGTGLGGSDDAYLEFAVPRIWMGLSRSTDTVNIALTTGIGLEGEGFTGDLASAVDGDALDGTWSLPLGLDGDDDGLLLGEEWALGTDPQDADTDDDGLSDLDERDIGTDPLSGDTDGDELSDFDEWTVHDTNPLVSDTDGDGLSDGAEVLGYGTDPLDPLDPDPSIDEDCDGVSDEVDAIVDATGDADGDGLPNGDEWACSTDPCVADDDVDGDGISNADELGFGTNPCDAADPDQSIDEDCDGVADYADEAIELANDDVDEDGVTNVDELACGTDPCTAEADHDGDGILSTDEQAVHGTDPCDPADPDQTTDEDCDGIPDYADDAIAFDPLGDNDDDGIPNALEQSDCNTDPCSANPDADRDGVANVVELACGTNPCSPDSDADGLWDGDEMDGGACPDSDEDGTIDALDPDAPPSADPTEDEDGVHGLSGGTFTGGSCAAAPAKPVAWLALLGAVLLLRRRPRSSALVVMLGAASAPPAVAEALDANQFNPAPVNRLFLGVADPVSTPRAFTRGVWAHYARKPLLYRYTNPNREPLHLVRDLWSLTPHAGWTNRHWFGAVHLPIHGMVGSDLERAWGVLGDARFTAGHTLADRNVRPLGVAVVADVSAPTGSESLWLGRSGFRAGAALHAASGRQMVVGGSVGIMAGSLEDLPGFRAGTTVHWRLSGSMPLAPAHRLGAEVHANHTLSAWNADGAHGAEAVGHWSWAMRPAITLASGLAVGLNRGVAVPRYRTFAGLHYAPAPTVTARKTPPTVAESLPAEAEPTEVLQLVRVTVTGPDGRGLVAQVATDATLEAPFAQTNADGVATFNVDPEVPALWVGSAGFAAARYPLPTTQTAVVEIAAVLHPARVTLEAKRIRIDDKIFFETGKAVIQPQSHALLNEVALVMLDHPAIAMVEVRGFTDDLGSADDNLLLSRNRAQAVVDYLITVGVDASRLRARGLGEAEPRAAGTDSESRAANRRVEFVLVSDTP